MLLVLLGGAPGVGKSSVARRLLVHAATSDRLVQWVEVDALWMHQPWEVTARTISMMRANLRSVLANAEAAGIHTVIVTWVFQNQELRDVVIGLAPAGIEIITAQLTLGTSAWRARWTSDPTRPPIDLFFEDRYAAANSLSADHLLATDNRTVAQIASTVATALGWPSEPPQDDAAVDATPRLPTS